jgi:alpha/beta superfamily hydrolase
LDSVLDAFSQKPRVRIVAGADHFWAGHENEMIPEVVKHFSEYLK